MRKARDLGERLGEMRLAGCRHAADDDHQRQPGLPCEPLGQREQVAGGRALMAVLAARGRMLGGAQQRDLRAHQRPVGGVERDQPILAWITACVPVGAHQHACEPLGPARYQIHHQEREVVGHVDFAQPPVELDAVNDLHGLLEQHVLGPKVAVDLAHEAAPRAGVEHLRMGDHERVREALERQHPLDLRTLLDDRQ